MSETRTGTGSGSSSSSDTTEMDSNSLSSVCDGKVVVETPSLRVCEARQMWQERVDTCLAKRQSQEYVERHRSLQKKETEDRRAAERILEAEKRQQREEQQQRDADFARLLAETLDEEECLRDQEESDEMYALQLSEEDYERRVSAKLAAQLEQEEADSMLAVKLQDNLDSELSSTRPEATSPSKSSSSRSAAGVAPVSPSSALTHVNNGVEGVREVTPTEGDDEGVSSSQRGGGITLLPEEKEQKEAESNDDYLVALRLQQLEEDEALAERRRQHDERREEMTPSPPIQIHRARVSFTEAHPQSPKPLPPQCRKNDISASPAVGGPEVVPATRDDSQPASHFSTRFSLPSNNTPSSSSSSSTADRDSSRKTGSGIGKRFSLLTWGSKGKKVSP